LAFVLRDPEAKKRFQQYCEQELSPENLLAYDAVIHLRTRAHDLRSELERTNSNLGQKESSLLLPPRNTMVNKKERANVEALVKLCVGIYDLYLEVDNPSDLCCNIAFQTRKLVKSHLEIIVCEGREELETGETPPKLGGSLQGEPSLENMVLSGKTTQMKRIERLYFEDSKVNESLLANLADTFRRFIRSKEWLSLKRERDASDSLLKELGLKERTSKQVELKQVVGDSQPQPQPQSSNCSNSKGEEKQEQVEKEFEKVEEKESEAQQVTDIVVVLGGDASEGN